MPLPYPEPREELHLRRIEVRGYRRGDGLYEVEGRIVDTKSYAFALAGGVKDLPPGKALHEMTVRITLDENLTVQDAIAATDASPHHTCPEAAPSVERLKGLSVGAGWNRAIRERLGGAAGCQHINELLAQMATTAFQTLSPLRSALPPKLDANGRPLKIDSCYAYGSERELVLTRWPDHYTGPPAAPGRRAG